MDERCAACRIKGGPEEPCVSAQELAFIEEDHGRPCPRVESLPENSVATRMIAYLTHGDLMVLAETAFATFSAEEVLGLGERAATLERLASVLSDVEVYERLHPKHGPTVEKEHG